MQDFHHILLTVHEDKYPSVTDILVHQGVNHTTECVKTFAHIYRKGIQVIPQRGVKMEHNLNLKGIQVSAALTNPAFVLSAVLFRWDRLSPAAYYPYLGQVDDSRSGIRLIPVPEQPKE